MSFSAVLLSYNHPELTRQSLESLISHFKHIDIFLIHNGSEKITVEVLKNKFPEVNHVYMPENKGYSGGCNFGLMTAFKRSNWVYFFTNDTACVQIPKILPEPGFYAPTIYRATHFHKPEKKIDSVGGYFNPKEKKLVHAKSVKEFEQSFQMENIIPYVPGSAFLMHISVFEQVGPMDESLHTYWEDVDFSARAFKLGIKPAIAKDFILTHKGGRTCRKNTYYTNILFKRNRDTICNKYNWDTKN